MNCGRPLGNLAQNILKCGCTVLRRMDLCIIIIQETIIVNVLL